MANLDITEFQDKVKGNTSLAESNQGDILGTINPQLKRLQESVDDLRSEVEDLNHRITKLENAPKPPEGVNPTAFDDLKIEVGNIKMQSDAMYNCSGDFTSENQTQNLDAKVKRIEEALVRRLPDQFAKILNPDSQNA